MARKYTSAYVIFQKNSMTMCLTYAQQLMYNGYPRHVISRNPPRVDQDGDVVDSENENSDLDTTDAEDDPYRDVHLESKYIAGSRT